MNIARLRPNRRFFLLAAVACLTIGWAGIIPVDAAKPSPEAAPKSEGAGRLVITRSATLGSYMVGLTIDGKQAAMIQFGGHYDAPLAAGPHVLTIIPVPNRMAGQPTKTNLVVQAGKTYSFTAKRDNDNYILK